MSQCEDNGRPSQNFVMETGYLRFECLMVLKYVSVNFSSCTFRFSLGLDLDVG